MRGPFAGISGYRVVARYDVKHRVVARYDVKHRVVARYDVVHRIKCGMT